VADFETKLRELSERGSPVGAEELIERIEVRMAGDPLVVVAKRREGALMTKTQQPPTAEQPSRFRGPVWAVAAFVVVLAVAGIYLATSGDDDQVAETTPNTETMTDLETIQAGVDALYSGDADRAVELFEVRDLDDESIRRWAAFQAAVDGRLTLDCTEQNKPGVFSCRTPYHNALTNAIGWVDAPGDIGTVVVEDGVITNFHMPVHTFIHRGVEEFLIEEGAQFLSEEERDLIAGCVFCSYDAEVATLAMDHLDEWATWAEVNLELPGPNDG
jgi:hypothetical protein